MNKIYYRLTLKNTTPLAIGSGQEGETDKSIARDSYGNPVIPATALAGAISHQISIKDQEILGQNKKDNEDYAQSQIIFYDAKIQGEEKSSIRDGIALDAYKTTIEGAKYDFEILEPGHTFRTYLEYDENGDVESTAIHILEILANGAFYLGSKTTRGYGKIDLKKVEYIKFDLTNDKTLMEWLDFDVFNTQSNWSPVEVVENKDSSTISYRMMLKQEGFISIRKYITSPSKFFIMPDQEQLTYKEGKMEIPVIPGTSWAGAFRHHLNRLAQTKEEQIKIKTLFGYTDKTKSQKSQISFNETTLKSAKSKIVMRNAIDRFTNATIDGNLFTEKVFEDGQGTLVITIPKNTDQEMTRLLEYAILDLHYGFLSIGGATAIGRGLFKIESLEINGKACSIEALEKGKPNGN